MGFTFEFFCYHGISMLAIQVADWDYDHCIEYCSPQALMTGIQGPDLTPMVKLHRGIITFIFLHCAL
jgi:hypothetical protein